MRVNSHDLTLTHIMPGNNGMTKVGSSYIGGTMDLTDANAYWQYHHGSNWPTAGGAPISRYAAYQQELNGTATFVPGTENQGPSCSGWTTGSADRRIIGVAIVDCLSQGVNGNANVQLLATKYADFFVAQPVLGGNAASMGKPGDNVVYVEFVRYITPGLDNSKLKHIVQLYR